MSPLLSLILIPLGAALLIAAGSNARRTCFVAFGCNLVLSLYILGNYHFDQGGYQFVWSYPIIPWAKLNFMLGVDGLSLALLLLSTIVSFSAILVTHKVERYESWFYVCILFISAGVIGAFASLDLFFFYSFHELALIPTFLLIGIWGSGDRQTAAWKATIYLAVGSFILLLGIVGLYFACPPSLRTFDMRELQMLSARGMIRQDNWVYLLLFIGFGILVAIFPFHSWAPSAYASAPAPAAMLHAGVLKKFGLYGLLRIVIPMFPQVGQQWATHFLILVVGNLLFVGLVTLAQKRLDWMLGYSSVMHMGYIFLGIAVSNMLSLAGAAILIFAHGLSIAALFALCGELRVRTETLEFKALGGLAQKMPRMGLFFGLAGIASIGVPGFANFVGELLVFFGAFEREATLSNFGRFQIADMLVIWGIVLSAIYFFRAYRFIFFGTLSQRWRDLSDIQATAGWGIALLILALLVIGFYPQPFLQLIVPSLICP